MSEGYKKFYGLVVGEDEPPIFFPTKSMRHAADHRIENHIDVIEYKAVSDRDKIIHELVEFLLGLKDYDDTFNGFARRLVSEKLNSPALKAWMER